MNETIAELTPLPDEDVLARVLTGDVAAFELLMRRHNQGLYRVARSVLRHDLEAEDIVQETYVRAYMHLSRFEGRSSVATGLTRIAFHEALRRRRRRLHAMDIPDRSPSPDYPRRPRSRMLRWRTVATPVRC